jgi:hypothetical protein
MSHLVPIFCSTCPDWYDLPDREDTPVRLWILGGTPEDLTSADLPSRGLVMHQSHDYRLTDTQFRFMYSGGAGSWVVIEYPDTTPRGGCPHCQASTPPHARFCPMCGGQL